MLLPEEVFTACLAPGTVIYFSSNQLNTPVSHYFVCLRVEGERVFLAVFTSQFAKRSKAIERRNLPLTTLVWVEPESENGLLQDSYVDCNKHFHHTQAELYQLYFRGDLKVKGTVKPSKLYEIILGLLDSPEIEQEVKDGFTPVE